MKDLTFWLALVGGEVLLLVFVLLLAYWIRQTARTRRDRRAIARLVAAVKAGRAEREAAIGDFLARRMGLEGAALNRMRVAMMREELALLQRFAGIYRDRDAGHAAQFHIALESALEPWFELQGGGTAQAGGADEGELEALRQENQRLSEELSVTMETMSRMLSEYSSMFAGSEVTPEPVQETPVAEVDSVPDAGGDAGDLPGRPAPRLDAEALDIGDDGADVAASATESADEVAPVAPEAIDELLAGEPLAQDLGGLFDDDELAALDEAEPEDADAPDKAIVI